MCREGFPLVSQLVASTYALSLHVLKTLLGMVTLPTWCGKWGRSGVQFAAMCYGSGAA